MQRNQDQPRVDRERGRGRARGRARSRGRAPADRVSPDRERGQPQAPRVPVPRDLQYRARTYNPPVHHLDTRTQRFVERLGLEPRKDHTAVPINPHGPGQFLRSLFTARALGHLHAQYDRPAVVVDAYGAGRTQEILAYLNGREGATDMNAPEPRPLRVLTRGPQLVAADLRRRRDEGTTDLFAGPEVVDALLLVNVYHFGPDPLTPHTVRAALARLATGGSDNPRVILLHRDFCQTYGTDDCGTYVMERVGGAILVRDTPYEIPQVSAPYGPHPSLEWAMIEGSTDGVSWYTLEARGGMRLTMCQLAPHIPNGFTQPRPNPFQEVMTKPDPVTWYGWVINAFCRVLPSRASRPVIEWLAERGWVAHRRVTAHRVVLALLVQKMRARTISPYWYGQANIVAKELIESRVDVERFNVAYPGLLETFVIDHVHAAMALLTYDAEAVATQLSYVSDMAVEYNHAVASIGKPTSAPSYWQAASVVIGVLVLFAVGVRTGARLHAAGTQVVWMAPRAPALGVQLALFLAPLSEELARAALLNWLPLHWATGLNSFLFPLNDFVGDMMGGLAEGVLVHPTFASPHSTVISLISRTVMHTVFLAVQRAIPGTPGVAAAMVVHYAYNALLFALQGVAVWPLFGVLQEVPVLVRASGWVVVVLAVLAAAAAYYYWRSSQTRPRTRWQMFRDAYLNGPPEDRMWQIPGAIRVEELPLDGQTNVSERTQAPTQRGTATNPEFEVEWHVDPLMVQAPKVTSPVHHALAHDVPFVVPARTIDNLVCIVEQRLIAPTPYNKLERPGLPGSLIQLAAWLGVDVSHPKLQDTVRTLPERVSENIGRYRQDAVLRTMPRPMLAVLLVLNRVVSDAGFTEIKRDDAPAWTHSYGPEFGNPETTVLSQWIDHLPSKNKAKLLKALQELNHSGTSLVSARSTEVMTKTDEQLYKLDQQGDAIARVSKPRPIANVAPLIQAETGPEIYEATRRMKYVFGVTRRMVILEWKNRLVERTPIAADWELHRRVWTSEPDVVLPFPGSATEARVPAFIIYAPGHDHTEMSALLTVLFDSPQDFVLILIAGDDAAIYMRVGKVCVAIEYDGKTYDQCQAAGPLTFEYSCDALLGVPFSVIAKLRHVSTVPYKAMLRTRTGPLAVATISPRRWTAAHRDTGGSNTSHGNSLVNMPIALTVADVYVAALIESWAQDLGGDAPEWHSNAPEFGGPGFLKAIQARAEQATAKLGFELKIKSFAGSAIYWVATKTTFLKSFPAEMTLPRGPHVPEPVAPIYTFVGLDGRVLKMFKTLTNPQQIVRLKWRPGQQGRRVSYERALRYVIGQIMRSSASTPQGLLVEAAIEGWAPYADDHTLELVVPLERATGYRPSEFQTGTFVPRALNWCWQERPRPPLSQVSGWRVNEVLYHRHGVERYGPVFEEWRTLADLLRRGTSCFLEHPLWAALAAADYN